MRKKVILAIFFIIPIHLFSGSYTIEQYLKIRRAFGPTISPDAQEVAFLTNITGTNQVWKVNINGGWPHQLTFFDERVQFVHWNPVDKNWLLFGKDVGGNEKTQLFLLKSDGSKVKRLTSGDDVIYRFGGWSEDGKMIAYTSNERNRAFFDVYIMDVQAGSARRIWEDDGNNIVAGWSHNGEYLIVSKLYSSFNNDLYLVNVKTGKVKHLTPHRGSARYRNPRFSKDDKRIYLISDEGMEFMGIAYIDIDGGGLNYIYSTSWDVQSFEISTDGSMIYFILNVDGYYRAYSLDLGTGMVEPLDLPSDGLIVSLRLTSDGRKLVFSYQSPTRNQDIYVYDLQTREMNQITFSSTAGIPVSSFVGPELVRFKSFDGLEIPGFLYIPRGARRDSSLPVIVYIHGGPESQARAVFSPLFQYFINNGYAVYVPNIRGSTGYGKTYAAMDNGAKRKDAIRDVSMIPGFLRSTGYIDPGKIAVFGGSYGGYMVLAAVTFYPELWAAGVDIVGISNFITFLKTTGVWRRKHRMAEYGDPDKIGDVLREISPFYHVDKIKAPLMIIQGANDPRVPKSESDQIVESIRSHGGIVKYIVFEDEGHGISKLKNRIRAYRAVVDFLDRYVKNKE